MILLAGATSGDCQRQSVTVKPTGREKCAGKLLTKWECRVSNAIGVRDKGYCEEVHPEN